MSFVTINYDEGNKETLGYESVEVHYGKDQKKIFNTGNFIKDWYDYQEFKIKFLLETEPFFTESSSVNHFIMDGAPYDCAYLHVPENELKYIDRSDPMWYITQRDVEENGIEFFVSENTKPTWKELKEMCK